MTLIHYNDVIMGLKSPANDCLRHRLIRSRSKKTSNLRVTGLCAGNSPVTGEFLTQMLSDAEDVSVLWRHHIMCKNTDSYAGRGSILTIRLPETSFTYRDNQLLTPGNAWVRSQHCGYWCPGAEAPDHQNLQCWLNIHCIGAVSYKNIAHTVNSIRKWNHILKKMT